MEFHFPRRFQLKYYGFGVIGTTIAHYKVTAKLGQGGMGEVYRATDTKLDREVAIKVLPESFAVDIERLARFEREAKSLAALNHPNIAGIFGLEETADSQALVLELVEGDDLSDVLKRGPLPIEETLDICKQIAEALEAAHEKGIIHRDLKPGNIKITGDGKVKVLDFGLAKALSDESDISDGTGADDSPTITDAFTKPGTILGTAAYMSPEQARGKHIDKRTDIWAFGCVLFECLTGKKAFQGEDTTDILATIIKGEPDWRLLPTGTPPSIRHLLRKCFIKETRKRLKHVEDARIDLELIKDSGPDKISGYNDKDIPNASEVVRHPYKTTILVLLVSLFSVALGWGFRWRFGNDGDLTKVASANPLVHLSEEIIPLHFPGKSDLDAYYRNWHTSLTLSPDGKQCVIQNGSGLWHINLNRVSAYRLLTGEKTQEPFWNDESTAIAYVQGEILYMMDVSDPEPTPTKICSLNLNAPANHGGGMWWRDDIFFNTGDDGIYRVSANASGQPPESVLPNIHNVDNIHEVSALPDGRGLIYPVHRRHQWIDTIAIWTPDEGQKDILELPEAILVSPVYAPSGHIVYGLQGEEVSGLYAFEFDLNKLERSGEPFLLDRELGPHVSISRQGIMMVSHQPSSGKILPHQLLTLWHPVQKTKQPIHMQLDLHVGFATPRYASGGNLLAYWALDKQRKRSIWWHDVSVDENGSNEQLTWMEKIKPTGLFWVNNDQHIIYSTGDEKGARVFIRALGEKKARFLFKGQVADVSRDGHYILLHGQPRWGLHSFIEWKSIQQTDVESDLTPMLQVLPEEYRDVWNPALSPDGKHMAFVSGEQRRNEHVYVVDFPAFDEPRRVVSGSLGGSSPVWHPNGKQLYYVTLDRKRLMSVEPRDMDWKSFQQPKEVCDLPDSLLKGDAYHSHFFDFEPGGERLLFVDRPSYKEKSHPLSTPHAYLIHDEQSFINRLKK